MTARILAVVALLALTAIAHEMTYRDEVAAKTPAPISTSKVIVPSLPDPQQACRKPDGNTEILVTLSWCIDGRCQHQCAIHPMDPDESPGATLQRLLDRKRTM